MTTKTSKHLATSAAITNYMIERVGPKRVDLLHLQGGQWVAVRSRIDRATADRIGFNFDNPRVQEVFDGIALNSQPFAQ